ncbi:MAG: trypsin-like peptidase domain-containing protein [Saccharofermentans sp.]|nr:trypsin-like peptidase domain-containing protein [Saccharofermentans sp.]
MENENLNQNIDQSAEQDLEQTIEQPVQEPVQEPVTRPSDKDKFRNYRTALIVLSVLTLASVLFSGIQSVYIFKLNTGSAGIMSYMRGVQTAADETAPATPVNSANLPDPWFSLEEAASIASPDKTTLSVVDIFKKVSPATIPISVVSVDNGKETKIGSGTGFIITEDGYIVTNQHVVVLADVTATTYYVNVILPDETEPVRAEVVGSDVQTDIAVLKVDTERKLPCVTLGDSDLLQAGELAVTIGNAMGNFDDSVTAGVISSPSREVNRNGYYVDIIQIDAAINPGNSGGPLINSYGEVVGITNAKIVSSTAENVGFAIPINSVTKIIEDLINYGKVIGRAYLGVSVKYVSDDSYYGAAGGVYVAEIVKGGPADQAGFVIGDRIVSMDGVEITQSSDIIKVRDAHEVGEFIEVIVERDGEMVTLNLEIGDSADY